MRKHDVSETSKAFRRTSLAWLLAAALLVLVAGFAGPATADSLASVSVQDTGFGTANASGSWTPVYGKQNTTAAQRTLAVAPGTKVLALASFDGVGTNNGGQSRGQYHIACNACTDSSSQPTTLSFNWTSAQKNTGSVAWIFTQNAGTATYTLEHFLAWSTGSGSFTSGNFTLVLVPLTTTGAGVTLPASIDSFGPSTGTGAATNVIDTIAGITAGAGDQVSSINQSGLMATAYLANSFAVGDRVFIKGALGSDYWNGYFTVTASSATSFTYFLDGDPGAASPTGGTIYAVRVAQRVPNGAMTLSGTTVKVYFPSSLGLVPGDRVAIQGATNNERFNGDFLVASTGTDVGGDFFTYTAVSAGGLSPATGIVQARRSGLRVTLLTQPSPTTSSDSVVTTFSPHGFKVGDRVEISGIGGATNTNSPEYLNYQGFFAVTAVTPNTFTYKAASGGLGTLVSPTNGDIITRRLEATMSPTWDPNAQLQDRNIYTLEDGVFLRKNGGASILQTSVAIPADPHIRRDVFLAFVASQGQVDTSGLSRWRYGNYQIVYQGPDEVATNTWRPVNQIYTKTTDGDLGVGNRDDQSVYIYAKLGASKGGTYKFRVKTAQRHGGTGVAVFDATLISVGMSWDNRPSGTAGWFKVLYATASWVFVSNGSVQWIDAQTIPMSYWFRTEPFSRNPLGSNFVAATSSTLWVSKGGGNAAAGYGLGARIVNWASGGNTAWGDVQNGGNGVIEGNRTFNGSTGAAGVRKGCLSGCETGSQPNIGYAANGVYPTSGTGMPPWEGSSWANLTGVDAFMNNDLVIFETTSYEPTWAAVEGLRAVSIGGQTTVSWNTSAELGSRSFRLEKYDRFGNRWVTVGPETIPALPPWPGGAAYQVDDPGAVAGASYEYRVVEKEVRGGEQTYGPFAVVTETVVSSTPSLAPSKAGWARIPNSPREAPVNRPSASKSALPWARSSWKAWVDDEGVYSITLDPKESAVSRNHQLTNLGRTVAVANDGAGNRLLFYGTPLRTLYTRRNAYLVKPGGPTFMRELNGKGPDPAAQPRSFPANKGFEEDVWPALGWVYDGSQDYWFWKVFMAEVPGYQSADVPLDLPLVDTTGGRASLAIGIHGVSESAARAEYHVRAWLNGRLAGDVLLDGSGPLVGKVDFDAGLLVSGQNTLRLEALLEPGVATSWWFLNRVDVTYPRLFEANGNYARVRSLAGQAVVTVGKLTTPNVLVFDVTNALAPVWIRALSVRKSTGPGSSFWEVSFESMRSGSEYVVVGSDQVKTASLQPLVDAGLATRTAGAEHVIVAPHDLLVPAEALASHRNGRGLTSSVVPLEAVWDEYGWGLQSADALKAFFGDASARWSPTPKYIALAGRGTFDPADNYGYADCLIPTWMVGTERGLVGSDSPYVAGLDAVIGRIPVTTAAALQAYVDKIARHDGMARRPRVTLAADNDDSGGHFAASSDQIGSSLPAALAQVKAYLGPMSVDQVKNEIKNAFGRGDAVVNWVGHGGVASLAAEQVLSVTDLPSIASSDRLSLFTGATCIVNGFHWVGSPSLGERLVTLPGAGAFATWAPTGVAYNDVSTALVQEFLDDALQPGGANRRIGDAIRSVRQSLPDERGADASFLQFQLLGDPACYVP